MNAPRLVVLGSGHMIDRRDRASPRFPPQCEPVVARAIAGVLQQLGVRSDDLGVTQGACGADLLFAEAMLERGAAIRLMLPQQVEDFIRDSVAFPKPPPEPDKWEARFQAVRSHPRTTILANAETQAGGSVAVYTRCNSQMLEYAQSLGSDPVHLVTVSDGSSTANAGGAEHMRAIARASGVIEHWIDSRVLCLGQ